MSLDTPPPNNLIKKLLRFRLMLALPMVLLSGVWLWLVFSTPSLRPVLISPYDPPTLSLDRDHLDFGTAKTDSKAEATFILTNVGGAPLRILDTQTSCGCTVASLSRNILMPGDISKIKVVMDTSIKLGRIRKTVTLLTNDPKHPNPTLTVSGNVVFQMKGHGKIAVKDPLVLFKGACAECHVKKGIGKTGQALFMADCAMCHGAHATGTEEGAVATGLLNRNYSDPVQVAALRKIISEGAPYTPTMPPFSKAHGGPLNDSEIDSLLMYLQYQAETTTSNQPASQKQ